MKIICSRLCRVLLFSLFIFSGPGTHADAEGVYFRPIISVEGREDLNSFLAADEPSAGSRNIVPGDDKNGASLPGSAHEINSSAGPHGSISPAGIVTVSHGADRTFVITPEADFYAADVIVDGSHVGPLTVYKFSGVTGNHTISVIFAPCSYSLVGNKQDVGASGGNFNFDITASNISCAWSAESDKRTWISTASSGTGNGTGSFTVSANPGPARSGSVTVGGKSIAVNQASGCSFELSPVSHIVPAASGSHNFIITASDGGCAWTATSNSPSWITTSGSGTGNGTIDYTVRANTGPERSSSISVGGRTFSVNQSSGCVFTFDPASSDVGTEAGYYGFAANASDSSCSRAATTDSPSWISTSGRGTGNGTVGYSVSANIGPARTGSIIINGQAFTVRQASGCTFSLTPAGDSIPAMGGDFGFSIIASDKGCAWSAKSNEPTWIATTSSGTGNGTVKYAVAANSGLTRIGSLTAGGEKFILSQGNGCRYKLSQTSPEVGPAAGSYSVAISVSDGACPWTATSNNPSWITTTDSGNGDGIVNYRIQLNAGPERTGSITVGGRNFTATQGNGCGFMLNPTGDSIAPSDGSYSFGIAASAQDCPWTAKSKNPEWIVTDSSGVGDGTIKYAVAANNEGVRKGLLLVGGQSFSVNQASGINYQLTVNKSGSGTGTVSSSETPDQFIYCDGGCSLASALYVDGTEVRLKAMPDESSFFNEWTGACSGSGDCSVRVDRNKSVAATFIRKVRIVHATAGTGGSISPFSQAARHGETMQFMVTPNMGHHISSVSGCGITRYRSSTGSAANKKEKAGKPDSSAAEVYITAPITADCSVRAEFAADSFTVTPYASENGSISSAIPLTVGHNDTVNFEVKADAGYHIESVSGCGGNDYTETGKINTGKKPKSVREYFYTTGKITRDCTLNAKFAIDTYTVTPRAEKHGRLEPSTPQSVNRLDMTSFTVTPDPGYHIASVTGCGGELISEDEYVAGDITEDCTVTAVFQVDMQSLIVKLSGNGGGTISAAGLKCDGRACNGSFEYGKKVVLRINPDTGSRVEDVKVNGSMIGPQKTVVIAEVKDDYYIEVFFTSLRKK